MGRRTVGILNWLTLQRAGETHVELDIAPEEAEFSGLDLKSALEAHRAWRQRLVSALADTSTEQLVAGEAGRSDHCTLGQWLTGPGGETYGHLAEYRALLRAHAKFHIAASAVLIAHHAGNREEAFRILSEDFQRRSDQLDLARLFAQAKR